MKKIFITLVALFVMFGAWADNAKKPSSKGYTINLNVKGMRSTDAKKDSAYLAYYMNGKTYSTDTTELDKSGHGVFSKKKKLDEGIYIIYFNSSKYFDILIGDNQNLTISVDTSDLQSVSVAGAPESVDFQKYIVFLTGMLS